MKPRWCNSVRPSLPNYRRYRFRLHPGGREMLRVTLFAASGRVAGRDADSAAGERADARRIQGHPGSPGRPSEPAGDRRSDAASRASPSSSASQPLSSQQPQEET